MEAAKKIMPELIYANDPYEACEGADGVVLMTEWNEYRSLDLIKLKKIMKNPVFIDLRNVYEPKTVKDAGFSYCGVGRN
jgi:UDPglucose 6-dehydrogenase